MRHSINKFSTVFLYTYFKASNRLRIFNNKITTHLCIIKHLRRQLRTVFLKHIDKLCHFVNGTQTELNLKAHCDSNRKKEVNVFIKFRL